MYQVWLVVEEWEGDNKICDIETDKLGETKTEEEARAIYDNAQEALAVLPEDF